MTDVPGGEPRDERVETNPDADLAEVLRDDALLDAIGSSPQSGWAVLPEDEVTRLLRAWQEDASAYAAARTRPPVELPATAREDPPAGAAAGSRHRHARPRAGRRLVPRSAAAISAAAAAGVVLSIGGVAAAVTGDPLTPLKVVVSGLGPASWDEDERQGVMTEMPRELASVRTAIRQGDLDEARRKLTDARAQAETLDPGPERVDALDDIESLEEDLERAEQAGPQPSGTATVTPSPTATSTPSPDPSPPVTTEPEPSTPTPTPSTSAEPTPSTSSTAGEEGRAPSSPPQPPQSPPGAGYDGGVSS